MKTNIRQSVLLFPQLSYIIQGAIFEIRRDYGPGQKEVIYRRLMEEKLKKNGLKVEKEKKINIYSKDSGKIIGVYQPDLVIENKVIVEIKSSRFPIKLDEKQLYFYLRNSQYELGYLVNFSTPKLFIKRIVYSNNRKSQFSVFSLSISR